MSCVIEIPLTQGHIALIDCEDFDFISSFKWCACKGRTGLLYAVRGIKRNQKSKTVKMHRVILGITDPAISVDHRNHNGLDNRRENLRVCSQSENLMNSTKRSGVSSRFKGVSFAPHANLWRAYINKDGRRINLGYCKTEDEAAERYNAAAKVVFGEFAFLNNLEIENVNRNTTGNGIIAVPGPVAVANQANDAW